jgi:predicted GIY-YIG superfamily endonuclease
MELHVVYVLQSLPFPARHYSGLTTDVTARLGHHNAGQCRHTAKFRPWRLLVSIEFADAARAAAFERYLKSGSGREFSRRHF